MSHNTGARLQRPDAGMAKLKQQRAMAPVAPVAQHAVPVTAIFQMPPLYGCLLQALYPQPAWHCRAAPTAMLTAMS